MNIKHVPINDVADMGFKNPILLYAPSLERFMNEDSCTSYLKLKTI